MASKEVATSERRRLGGLVEVAQVAHDELDVAQPLLRRLPAGGIDRLGRKVDAHELAPRVELGESIRDAATAAPDIEHADAGRQPVGQAGHQG